MHYALEFGVLLAGRLRRLSEGYERLLEPGDVWFQGAWEPHAYEFLILPGAALSFGVLPQVLHAEGLRNHARYDWMVPFVVPPESRPCPPAARRREFLSLAGKVIAHQAVAGHDTSLWRHLLFLEMMLLARQEWAPPSQTDAPPPEAYSRVSRAVGLVLASARPVHLGEAARACDLSRSAFCRLFRAAMGMSFSRYCLRHRLGVAAEQLRHTDAPAKAIAAAWGFNDASHFGRCFRRHYECTPAQYRERQT